MIQHLSGLSPTTNIVTKNMGVVKLQSVLDKIVTNHFGGEIKFKSPNPIKTVILTLNTEDTITISENYPIPSEKGDHVLSQHCTGVKLLAYDSLHNGVEVSSVDYTGQEEYCYSPIGYSPLLITPDNSNSIMGLIIYV